MCRVWVPVPPHLRATWECQASNFCKSDGCERELSCSINHSLITSEIEYILSGYLSFLISESTCSCALSIFLLGCLYFLISFCQKILDIDASWVIHVADNLILVCGFSFNFVYNMYWWLGVLTFSCSCIYQSFPLWPVLWVLFQKIYTLGPVWRWFCFSGLIL